MTRQRSTVVTSALTAPITTTLLVIENNYWNDNYVPLVDKKKPAKVTVEGKSYPVAAILGIRKTQEVATGYYAEELPIGYFYWAADKSIDQYVAAYFNEAIKREVNLYPYSEARKEKQFHLALPKLHKVVCKGTANSDGNYTQVIEDHVFTAKPVSLDLLQLDPDYSHPYVIPPSSTIGKISTRKLVFIYDESVKASYDIGPDEKPTGPMITSKKFSERFIETFEEGVKMKTPVLEMALLFTAKE